MPFDDTKLSAPATAAAQGLRSIAFGKLTDTAAPLLSYVREAAGTGAQQGPASALARAAAALGAAPARASRLASPGPRRACSGPAAARQGSRRPWRARPAPEAAGRRAPSRARHWAP